MLACGMDPAGVMAELTGRATGYSKGKGGSMHMFSREEKISSAGMASSAPMFRSAPVSHLPIVIASMARCASPISAMAQPIRARYQSFNMAELWKLPVVYIIENNQYAMGTAVRRSTAEVDLYKRGAAHNIPGEAGRRHGCRGGL